MERLWTDIRQAARGARRSPGLTAVVILTLALGIGANGAIFSVVEGIVLAPLPYPEPEELVVLHSQFPTMGFERFWISPPEYLEYRAWTRTLEDVAAHAAREVSLVGGDRPVRVRCAYTTASLFDVLGIEPLRGRVFSAEEDVPQGPPVVVLSEELWMRAFGGDPESIGSSVDVDGVPHTILGVMPRGFDIEENEVEVWLPMGFGEADMERRGNHILDVVGRLRDGSSLDAAQAELASLVAGWEERSGASHVPSPELHPLQMKGLHEEIVGGARPALVSLMVAVGLVLLIACANVANLFLARSESRRREMALRTAMGASRLRLLQQLLTESVLLSLVGGVVGLVLAQLGLRVVLAGNPESLPRTDEIGLDSTVLLVSLAIAVGTGLLFGIVPALQLSSARLGSLLKEGGGRASAAGAGLQLRRLLVVGELALAVGLVIGSVLMLRSLHELLTVDGGFEVARRSTFELHLPESGYPSAAEQVGFYARLLERLRSTPGIEAAAAASGLPPLRRLDANDMEFEGLERTPDGPVHNIDYWQFVTDDYLEVMGIRMKAGRAFRPSDDGEAPPVALVNERTAEVFWPGEDPLGRRLRPGWGDLPWFTVVGVVEDVKQGGLDQEAGTEIYYRYGQVGAVFGRVPRTMSTIVVSTRPADLAAALRREVWSLDPSLPVAKLRTLEEVVAGSVSRPRLLAQLLTLFGAIALFLAAIGIYGVMAYMVAERRTELGIRMAMGASRRGILQLVLSHGLLLTVLGLASGLGLSLVTSRVLASLLFAIEPSDPLTYAGVAVLLFCVGMLACALPALRATRLDPLQVLRYE